MGDPGSVNDGDTTDLPRARGHGVIASIPPCGRANRAIAPSVGANPRSPISRGQTKHDGGAGAVVDPTPPSGANPTGPASVTPAPSSPGSGGKTRSCPAAALFEHFPIRGGDALSSLRRYETIPLHGGKPGTPASLPSMAGSRYEPGPFVMDTHADDPRTGRQPFAGLGATSPRQASRAARHVRVALNRS